MIPTFSQVYALPATQLTTIFPFPEMDWGREITFDYLISSFANISGTIIQGGASLYLSFRVLMFGLPFIGLPFF